MEKLNKIERLKAQLPPAAFEERLASFDWAHPDEADRFYLKNFGIYNIKLRPERWMIRLRIDGGKVAPRTLRLVARTAHKDSLRILLTARGQIELHGLGPDRVHPVWRHLTENGLQAYQTLTDNFRAVVTDPLADCAPDARIDTFPPLKAIRELFLHRSKWLGTLPRKFNTALVGRETPSFNPWGNDLLFALAKQNGKWGFNLYLGGKNSETAKDADIFSLPEDVPDLFGAVARAYRSHGPRGSRAKTRLFHLIEAAGIAQLRIWIEETYGTPLPKAGELRMQSSTENRDHRLPLQRFGRYGEIDTESLLEIAETAERERLTLRLTPHQELWAFDREALKKSTEKTVDSHPLPSPIFHPPSPSITACAGSRYCPLSLWDIKKDLALLPVERLRRLGVGLGFSGCLKGCGRHYHSDLGLIGLRTNLYGATERAARVFVGAVQSSIPTPARMLYYSVPLRRLDALIHTILDDFERSGSQKFETFSRNVLNRYDIEFLQLWYLVRQLYDLPEDTRALFGTVDEAELLERFDKLKGYPDRLPIYENTRELSHRLWDLDAAEPQ